MSGNGEPTQSRGDGAAADRRPQRGGERPCASAAAADVARARAAVAAVVDPEIPVLTIEDLGVLRRVERVEGSIRVVLTPTYIGCPATAVIAAEVAAALAKAGLGAAAVVWELSPPWGSDAITASGRSKLAAYGIAPPERRAASLARFADTPVTCPRCGSRLTEKISEFGATPCKALWRCTACREPFEYFKCL
jgi:ring-1,2-phenylacetyl-CoA epoxidase subunit PaaD